MRQGFFQSSKHFKEVLLLPCRLYLLNRSVSSSFHEPLQFREQEKVTGARSGEYGGCCITSVLFLAKNSMLFLVEIEQFWYEFRVMPKSLVKIEWHDPTVIRRLTNIIFFTSSIFSSVVDFVVHIFSAIGKHFVPPINVASVQGSFTICHSQHSEYVRALNLIQIL